jgi:tRNA modification GTPase
MTRTPPHAIFCELTPPGRGGISTLGLFGPGILDTVKQVFRSSRPLDGPAGALVYGHIVGDDRQALDEVVVRVSGASDVEVHCHGGPAAVEAVARRLESCGLVRCDWERFVTLRGEAEGLGRIGVEAALLLPRLAALRPSLVVAAQSGGLLATAVADAAARAREGDLGTALRRLDELLAGYERTGRFLVCPPRIAVLGPPNSGKSSLVNRLLETDRVIVTDVPGTTRDVVTETATLDGLPVVLADTAGLRTTADAVERAGVERARVSAATADVVLIACDLSGVGAANEGTWAAGPRGVVLRVGTKADLAAGMSAESGWGGDGAAGAVGRAASIDVATSAETGQGIEPLRRAILERLGFRWPGEGEAVPFTSSQAGVLGRAREELDRGRGRAASDLLAPLLPLSR